MFSQEQRMRAVELYIKYDLCAAPVIRELSYPTYKTLISWYEEYQLCGNLHKKIERRSKFTDEQRIVAVEYFLEHGKSVSRTVKVLGYPSRPLLAEWIDEVAPNLRPTCRVSSSLVRCSQEQKEQAVIDLCAGKETAQKIASDYGVSRLTLHNWKKQLLSKGSDSSMRKKINATKTNFNQSSKPSDELLAEKEQLTKQVDDLQQQLYRLRLEKDILEKAAEVIKKDQGVNLKTLTNHEKAIVIDALRSEYQLKDLLKILNMAKSSYCYQEKTLNHPDKYADLRESVKATFAETYSCYGYRRIHVAIKAIGTTVSEKVIRRIMKEEQLVVSNNRKRKYNSYQGEISPEVENIVNRDFHADNPNIKWLTDITEFRIPAGKIYLSPIIDCFDGMPVSWTIGTSPDADLVNTMLDEAIALLKKDEHPIIHSDRGCHYRWPGWVERMGKANLIRSMSKKGCSPDNSACEGFFGRLKNEMFYGRSWMGVSVDEFIQQVNLYIKWYIEKRIKLSLGSMSPLNYRRSLGLAA